MLTCCSKHPVPQLVNHFSFSSVDFEVMLIQDSVELECLSCNCCHFCSSSWLACMIHLLCQCLLCSLHYCTALCTLQSRLSHEFLVIVTDLLWNWFLCK